MTIFARARISLARRILAIASLWSRSACLMSSEVRSFGDGSGPDMARPDLVTVRRSRPPFYPAVFTNGYPDLVIRRTDQATRGGHPGPNGRGVPERSPAGLAS